jgi:carotenoid 1,2-hydratase
VFSPYYAWSRRRHGDAGALPEAHCAINLSLYRRAPGATHFARHWAMTERGAHRLQRQAQQLRIGPSGLAWQADGSLAIDIDERCAPWPQRLRGRMRLVPDVQPARDFVLHAEGHHVWQPIAPRARVQVDFDAPACCWEGEAYLDANRGHRPLERDFTQWQWSRTSLDDGGSLVVYDAQPRSGPGQPLALAFDAQGALRALPLPQAQPLRPTAWGVARQARSEAPSALLATLESGPFYARSLLHEPHSGRLTVHESLSLARFRQPWVQALLPFRMPRWSGSR